LGIEVLATIGGLEIQLEALDTKHAPATFEWLEDSEIADGIGLTRSPSLKLTRDWIAAAKLDSTVRAFAIIASGQHVGNVVLDHINRPKGSCRFHIYIGDDASRGRGIGTSATRQAIEYAFDVLNLELVWLTVRTDNARAIRAYESSGFKFDRIMHEGFTLRGAKVDAFRMTVSNASET
jgi:RimJ/RimL family protein N-acetyltransferase